MSFVLSLHVLGLVDICVYRSPAKLALNSKGTPCALLGVRLLSLDLVYVSCYYFGGELSGSWAPDFLGINRLLQVLQIYMGIPVPWLDFDFIYASHLLQMLQIEIAFLRSWARYFPCKSPTATSTVIPEHRNGRITTTVSL